MEDKLKAPRICLVGQAITALQWVLLSYVQSNSVGFNLRKHFHIALGKFRGSRVYIITMPFAFTASGVARAAGNSKRIFTGLCQKSMVNRRLAERSELLDLIRQQEGRLGKVLANGCPKVW